MARVLAAIRLLPRESGLDLDKLADTISRNLPNGLRFHDSQKEPIAFGMEALRVNISMPDQEGYMNKLENFLGDMPDIQEFTVLMMTRI